MICFTDLLTALYEHRSFSVLLITILFHFTPINVFCQRPCAAIALYINTLVFLYISCHTKIIAPPTQRYWLQAIDTGIFLYSSITPGRKSFFYQVKINHHCYKSWSSVYCPSRNYYTFCLGYETAFILVFFCHWS